MLGRWVAAGRVDGGRVYGSSKGHGWAGTQQPGTWVGIIIIIIKIGVQEILPIPPTVIRPGLGACNIYIYTVIYIYTEPVCVGGGLGGTAIRCIGRIGF